MRAELGLPSVKGDDEHGGGMTGGFGGSMGGAGQGGKGKRPISVKFEIPYFTTSGIQVRYLKIIEPKVSAAVIRALLAICTPLLCMLYAPPPCNWPRLLPACCMNSSAPDLLQWPSTAMAGNLQHFLSSSRPLSRMFCHKFHGPSATRPGTVRWAGRSVRSCLDPVYYALER